MRNSIIGRIGGKRGFVNVLYSDGHAVTLSNADARFTVNLDDYQSLTRAVDRILGVLERADAEPEP